MLPEFALRMICGLSLVWCIAPRKEITSGFFRIQMLIVLGLSVLMWLSAVQAPGPQKGGPNVEPVVFGLGMYDGLLAFFGSYFWTLERRRIGTTFCFAIAFISTVVVVGVASEYAFGYLDQTGNFPLILADWLSASFFFGTTTAAMLLGHWYLTATGMSLKPLIRLNQYFLAAVVIRILVTAAVMVDGEFDLRKNWMLWTLRWAGLIGPLILGVLTIRILKYRNTQSATGVLYAATILVFMGEMAARLLEQAGLEQSA